MVARLSFAEKELPPRARRILRWETVVAIDWGTTSACAENTGDQGAWGASHGNYLRVRGEYTYRRVRGCETRNYLRVRGEYTAPCWHARLWLELPPRARRIPNMCSICHMICGTTSACAENTGRLLPGWMPARNYLRVRGEYSSTRAGSFLSMELPPRARRILLKPSMIGAIKGTTSACAENTRSQRVDLAPTWELPPRARRIQHVLCR